MTEEQANRVIELLEKLETTADAICSYMEMVIDRQDEIKLEAMQRNRGDYDD